MNDQISRFLITFGVPAVQAQAAATAILANPSPANINVVLTPFIADDTRRAQAAGGVLSLGLPAAAPATGTTAATGTGTATGTATTTTARHSHPWAWASVGLVALGALACSIVLPLVCSDDDKADKADVVAVDQRVTDLDAAAGSRLATLDTKVSAFGTRLATTEGNVTTLDGKVSAFGTRLATTEGNVTTLDGALVGLDTRVTATEGSLATVTTRSNVALSRLAALRKEFAAAKAPVVKPAPQPVTVQPTPQAHLDVRVGK